jgi:vacuolar-type H+-ATPase subunit H
VATDGTPSPEREQTDESLRTEREKADGGQVERQAAREQVADRVIRKAREQADAILVAAREKADRQLEETERSVESVSDIATVVEGRVLEDEALRHERASADEVVRREREERARALSRLLPLKRDKTDLHLLTERARSDDALSHRDDFLGIVSHDLRNLLSGIVLSAGVLARDAPEGEEGDRIAEGTASILRHSQASESLPASTERFIRRVCRTSPSDRGRRTRSP